MEDVTPIAAAEPTVEERLMGLIEPDAAEPEEEATEPVTEAEAPEAKEEPEEKATEEEEKAEEEKEEIDLDGVAEILGVNQDALSVDEDGKLMIKTKIDGKQSRVGLDELIKSYQTDGYVTQKSQALAEDKRAFEVLKEQGERIVQQRVAEASAVSQLLEAQLTAEFNAVNWEALRVQAPAEWVAKRQELSDRAGQINQLKQRAMGFVGEQMTQQQAKMDEEREARLRHEAESLQSKLPEWMDYEVAAKEQEKLGKFISEAYGFNPSDLDSVEDHRLLLMALDAKKYRDSQKDVDVAVKRVKLAARMVKPHAKADASVERKTKEQTKLTQLRKTGSIHDAAAVLMGRI
jgi:hypothetical protein